MGRKSLWLFQFITLVFLFIQFKVNPTNHLRKCLHRPVQQTVGTNNFTAGKCTYIQGQILHTTPFRNVRLPLVSARLSDEEIQKIGLCMFQTFSNQRKQRTMKLMLYRVYQKFRKSTALPGSPSFADLISFNFSFSLWVLISCCSFIIYDCTVIFPQFHINGH